MSPEGTKKFQWVIIVKIIENVGLPEILWLPKQQKTFNFILF